MRVSTFSRVDLPAPLPADHAEHLALGDLEGDVVAAPRAPRGLELVLLAGDEAAGVDERLPQRSVRGLELSEPVSLRDALGFDRDRPSDRVREARLGRSEDSETDDEEGDCDSDADRDLAADRAACRRPRPTASPLMTAVIGLNERIHCHFTGIDSTAYMHAGEERQHLEEDRNHVRGRRDSGRSSPRGRSPSPSAVMTASPMNSGAKSTSIPPGQVSYHAHHDEQDREADEEVDERHENRSEREQRAREVDLRHEIEVRGEAHARARERGCEVLHREDAGHHEHLVLHAPGREVREAAEDDDVDARP